MNNLLSDLDYLKQALACASIRRGFCSPNPSVGAVLVADNSILSTGYHMGPGMAHAEVDALSKVSPDKAVGATMYVTLEPCCHWGRTPPCTDALIHAGIKRVVYGYADPNPVVAGKGAAALLAADILCEHPILPEINVFYESYSHWVKTKTPFVTAKIAMSLDGKIAGISGNPLSITDQALNQFTHLSRRSSDAILTTAQTIIKDNPQLNARDNNTIISKSLYILDSQLNIPITAQVFSKAQMITIFHAKNAPADRRELLLSLEKQVRCIPIESDQQGLILEDILHFIGQEGVHDLWIEAGGKCFSAFMRKKLLQKAFIYIAPKWIGDGLPAFDRDVVFDIDSCQVHWQQFGKDVLCEVHW
jgi:diaminohydroxyphosphoribosylaminopyrimidine deaminase/5-amino-6-(5-phosphoribosylamino)uracil reductase